MKLYEENKYKRKRSKAVSCNFRFPHVFYMPSGFGSEDFAWLILMFNEYMHICLLVEKSKHKDNGGIMVSNIYQSTNFSMRIFIHDRVVVMLLFYHKINSSSTIRQRYAGRAWRMANNC